MMQRVLGLAVAKGVGGAFARAAGLPGPTAAGVSVGALHASRWGDRFHTSMSAVESEQWEKLVAVHTRDLPHEMMTPADTLHDEVKFHPDGSLNVPGTCVNKPGRLSVQQTYEPNGSGWAGGVRNEQGLHLESYRTAGGTGLESRWEAKEHFEGFPGMLAGGVIASLVECQGNWTAALKLMDSSRLRAPPLTTTASLNIQYLRPVPIDEPLLIRSVAAAPMVSSKSPNNQKVCVELTVSIRDPSPETPEDAQLVCTKAEGVFIKIGAMRDIREG